MKKIYHSLKIKHIDIIILISIIGFIMFKIANRSVGDIFLGVVMLATIREIVLKRHFFMHEKTVWILFAFILVGGVSWLHGYYMTPYTPKPLSFSRILNLFYFIVIAYWLKGNVKYVIIALSFFILSVPFDCLLRSTHPILEFTNGLHGQRVDFSITNANHPAALAGLGVIVSCFLLYIALTNRLFQDIRWRIGYLCYLFSMLIVNLLLVYMTFSRETWLALVIVAIFSLIYFYSYKLTYKKLILFIVVMICGFMLLYALIEHNSHIKSRVFAEQNTIEKIIDKKTVSNLPDSSTGLRVKFWYSAFLWVKKYPILGLGDINARDFTINTSPVLNKSIRDEYSHLHNGHLEFLVAYGIIGLSLVWLIFIYVIKSSTKLNNPHKRYILYGALAFTLYYFTINSFESFFTFRVGEQMMAVMLGCVYTFFMRERFNESVPLNSNTPHP